jgi:hypothetical protein
MDSNKTLLVASAALSLFAASGVASASVVGTASETGTSTSFFTSKGKLATAVSTLSLTGTGTLDSAGTYTASDTGSVIVTGFPNGTLTATESFTGTYNAGTKTFTTTAGSLDILTCTGSKTVCTGALNPALKPFNTSVSGSLTVAAGGTLKGTAFQPSAGTVGAVSSLYTFTVGAFKTPVPLPPAAWLLGSGLLGLVGTARRRRKV